MRLALLVLLATPLVAQEQIAPYPWQLPKETQDVLDRIHQTPISIDVADAPLDQALGFVKASLQLDLDLSAVDSPASKKVTLQVANVPGDTALRLLLDPHKLAWMAQPTKLVIAPPEKLPAGSPAEEVLAAIAVLKSAGHGEESEDMDTAALRRTLMETPIKLDMQRQTVATALDLVKNFANVNVVVEPGAKAGGKLGDAVTSNLDAKNIWMALDTLLASRGLGVWLGGGAMHVDTKDEAARRNSAVAEAIKKAYASLEKPVSVKFQATPLAQVAKDVEKEAGLPMAMDIATWNATPVITLEKKNRPLREVLDELRTQTGSSWYLYKGRIYLVR